MPVFEDQRDKSCLTWTWMKQAGIFLHVPRDESSNMLCLVNQNLRLWQHNHREAAKWFGMFVVSKSVLIKATSRTPVAQDIAKFRVSRAHQSSRIKSTDPCQQMVVCCILSLDTDEKPRSFVCPESLTIGHDTDKVTIQRCANILMECLRSITRTIYARSSLRRYLRDGHFPIAGGYG